jgi:hypothetical protein
VGEIEMDCYSGMKWTQHHVRLGGRPFNFIDIPRKGRPPCRIAYLVEAPALVHGGAAINTMCGGNAVGRNWLNYLILIN